MFQLFVIIMLPPLIELKINPTATPKNIPIIIFHAMTLDACFSDHESMKTFLEQWKMRQA